MKDLFFAHTEGTGQTAPVPIPSLKTNPQNEESYQLIFPEYYGEDNLQTTICPQKTQVTGL